jgi:competence protein ComEC
MRRWVLLAVVVSLVFLSGCADIADDQGGDIEGTTTGDDPQQTDDGASDDDRLDSGADTGERSDPPAGRLEIHHIDVGQADSTLLVTPEGETILVDTGDWQSNGAQVLSYLDTLGIERIDHLVATHPHADHIGGHAAVIEQFEENGEGVGRIYDSGQPHDTQTYENYLDAVDAYDHELLLVEAGDELPLSSEGVEAFVLNPPAGDAGDGFHDNSIALAVDFGDVRYLLTGDAEQTAERRLLEEWAAELDADIYQAGHHGSSTSSTEAFVDAVDPEVAVISSGYDSQFGHPHDEVLTRFGAHDIETYWTGVHGTVVVTTDGTSVDVTPAESFSTDPTDLLAEKPPTGRVGRMAAIAGRDGSLVRAGRDDSLVRAGRDDSLVRAGSDRPPARGVG